MHALNENNVPFVNDGEPVQVVKISTGLSLSVILGVLIVTVVASVRSPRGRAQSAISGARRHATAYLDLGYTADLAERERIYSKLLVEEQQLRTLTPKYRKLVREEHQLTDFLQRAHTEHDDFLSR